MSLKRLTLPTVLFVVLLATSTIAMAVPLTDPNGILLGATRVNVGGSLYNVTFVDGACIGLFNGCNATSDFTFETQSLAALASQALLDTIFVDVATGMFDSNPNATWGCGPTPGCAVVTPYSFVPDPGFPFGTVLVFSAVNSANAVEPIVPDHISGPEIFGPEFDTTIDPNRTFAIWTPVAQAPEPSTFLLLFSGLGLLAGAIHRRIAK